MFRWDLYCFYIEESSVWFLRWFCIKKIWLTQLHFSLEFSFTDNIGFYWQSLILRLIFMFNWYYWILLIYLIWFLVQKLYSILQLELDFIGIKMYFEFRAQIWLYSDAATLTAHIVFVHGDKCNRMIWYICYTADY